MKIIKREKYLQLIRPFIGKQLIKVLIGARRVGKTQMLLQIIDEIKNIDNKANIIYVNKEFHEFKYIKDDNDLYDYIIQNSSENQKNYVFVDEIQEISSFEITLRQLLVKDYDIYCTGSNANMLSSDLATHLSGRYVEFQINSLSYSEFLKFHKLDDSNKTLLKYIKYGGLPYLIHLPLNDEIVYGYLKSVYNSIVLKDVVARYNIRDIDFLDRLTEYISDNLGSYVSSKKIADFIKTQRISLSVNTVQNYLKYLCNSFFIQKTPRYDIQGKKIFEVNDKYYFSDLGLKHSVIPYKPGDISKVLENLVYRKLIEDGYKVYVGKLKNLEIDFIAIKGDETKYIQVAHKISDEKVFKREFGNLEAIKDNFEKIVVSNDELMEGNYKGIKHMLIREFLLG